MGPEAGEQPRLAPRGAGVDQQVQRDRGRGAGEERGGIGRVKESRCGLFFLDFFWETLATDLIRWEEWAVGREWHLETCRTPV